MRNHYRTLLILAFLLAPRTAAAAADDDLTVLPADPPPRKLLYNYLLQQAQSAFDARREAIAQIRTPEDIDRRRTALRAKFIEALGGFPDRTPLNPRVVGTLNRPGFRVERVVYESRTAHHVTALAYVPQGAGP